MAPACAAMLDWLRLLRASGFATIASNSIAVVAVTFYAGEGNQLRWLAARLWQQRDQVGWVVVTSLFLYAAGMVWNDIVDVDRDRTARPERPLARGRIGLGPAITVGILLIAGSLLASSQVRPSLQATSWYGVSLAGMVLCLGLLYNLVTKSIPVLGPLTMGLTRGTHALFALLILGEDHLRMALDPGSGPPQLRGLLLYPLIITLYTTGLTTIARVEDRDRSGTRFALLAGGVCMAAALLLALGDVLRAPWLPALLHSGSAWATGAVLAALAALAVGAWAAWRIAGPWWRALLSCRCRDVGPIIGMSLGGMILLDAVVATAGHPLLGLACLALFPPFVALARAVRMD